MKQIGLDNQQFQVVSAIMEETMNQSKLELTRGGGFKNFNKDEFILRPSTPLKYATVN